MTDKHRLAIASRWRSLLGIQPADGSSVEAVSALVTPEDRIQQAREAMIRLVQDRFGGDAVFADKVRRIAMSAEEAIAVLQEDEAQAPPPEQFEALEVIVAFDGSRPSFMVRQHEIDFASSYN